MKHVTIKVMLLVVAVIINGYIIYKLEVDRQTDYAYEEGTKLVSGDLVNGQFDESTLEMPSDLTNLDTEMSEALAALIESEPNVQDLTNENKFK